jgi:3D (Asp-Asp-Asp) domain-containing protein
MGLNKNDLYEFGVFLSVCLVIGFSMLMLTRPPVLGAPVETDIVREGESEDGGWVAPDPCGLDVVICDGETFENPFLSTSIHPTYRTVTAYTSTVEQTDATPCLSANGSNICNMHEEGQTLCAANFVPFGTILALSDTEESGLDTTIVCIVVDRLASKYPNRVDLYMGMDTPRALTFGVKTMLVREITFD